MIATGRQTILIAEDEPMVGLMIASSLQAEGFDVLGPAPTVAIGLKLLFQTVPTAAVLDITLRGGLVFPLADALLAAAVPFLFMSGNSAALLPLPHRARRLLAKPCGQKELLAALLVLLPSRVDHP